MAAVSGLAMFVLTAAGCGGTGSAENLFSSEHPLAAGLALLPDDPGLRRHVLAADLARLRRAYPEEADLQAALVGVWLPDALTGASRPLWRRAFGLRLEDISAFASAGFHPAELTVAEGAFAPLLIGKALRRSGYRARGGMLERGADGSLDATTASGRLVLSALNRVIAKPTRVTAASTSALARDVESSSRKLADDEDFAAAAAALDPVTSAVLLDAQLVRPPSGVPVRTLPEHAARLFGAGIDDSGPGSRTLKIALVYSDPEQARSDAARIERDLVSTSLPGAPGSRFSDIASEWRVTTEGRAIVITAVLPLERDAGTWRLLVERGDLAPLVRPRS